MNNSNKQETEDKPRWTRAVSRKEAVPDRFGKKELEAIIENLEQADHNHPFLAANGLCGLYQSLFCRW